MHTNLITHSDLGVAAVAIRSESVTNCPHPFRWLAPHPLVSPHCLSQPRLAPAPASPGPQLAEQPSSRTPATSPMSTTALTNRSLLLRTSQPLSPEQALQPWLCPRLHNLKYENCMFWLLVSTYCRTHAPLCSKLPMIAAVERCVLLACRRNRSAAIHWLGPE